MLLVWEYQAQGRDWAVLAGAITHLREGGDSVQTLLKSYSAWSSHFESFPLKQLITVVLWKPGLVV